MYLQVCFKSVQSQLIIEINSKNSKLSSKKQNIELHGAILFEQLCVLPAHQ